MSSDGSISVKKKSKPELCYYGKYQASLCLANSISIAHSLYFGRPNSYIEVFEKPEKFEEDFFSYEKDAWGDASVDINLDSEKIQFSIFCFVCAMEHEESATAKKWLLKLLPYFKGDQVPEAVKPMIEAADDIVDELWDGDVAEGYEFLGEGTFEVPFSELVFFKDLAYSWMSKDDNES